MLAIRSLPGKTDPTMQTSFTCTGSRVYSRTHSRKRWRCAVASESAAPELEGKSNVRDARSNIVPKPSKNSPPCSDRQGHHPLTKLVNKKLPTIRKALLSSAGKARGPGGLDTVLESYNEQPEHDRIPLHGGLPHPSAFPFAQLTVKLTSGCTLTIDDPDLV